MESSAPQRSRSISSIRQWLDEQLQGKPYGIDVLMAASHVDGTPEELERIIPKQHRRFVAQLEERFGIPPLPADAAAPTGIFGSIHFRDRPDHGLAAIDVGRSHTTGPCSSRPSVRLRGTVVERAHERGTLVGGMCGAVRHAQTHVEARADFVVAAGHEGAGVSTMVLVPEVVDAVSPVPVLAAGGIGNGRQIAAAMALARIVQQSSEGAPSRSRSPRQSNDCLNSRSGHVPWSPWSDPPPTTGRSTPQPSLCSRCVPACGACDCLWRGLGSPT